MEYKMKKSMALGVVIMLCAVAMVGVGYAAFNGHARTYNEGNAATAGYMTLTPGGEGSAAWNAITYDTTASTNVASADFSTYIYDSSGTKTAYYLNSPDAGTVTVGETSGYVVKTIGTKSFTLDNQTGASVTSVAITVTPTRAVGCTDFIYILTVNGVSKALSSTAETALEFTISDFAATEGVDPLTDGSSFSFDVKLSIGYVPNVKLPANYIGAATHVEGEDNARVSNVTPVDILATNALSLGFAAVPTA